MSNPKKSEISAADFLPRKLTLLALRTAASHCHGCPLYKLATQTVFGSGSDHAPLMIVGEIPGLKEDELGEPFVGPAGIFLRKTIVKVGLDIEHIYFSNVVKHFKFAYMNKRKLHRTPDRKEIKACMPWLEAEIEVIQPKVIVCLGLIAAKALISKVFHINEQRGKWFKIHENIHTLATFHPSAILRAPDENERHQMKKFFMQDMKKVSIFLSS